MKARTDIPAGLARHESPDFTIKGRVERIALRGLSHLARVLFDELLGLADHATGYIRTSYAVLASLCAVDAPPDGGPRPSPVTARRISVALDELRARDLVTALDREANELRKGLFLRVRSRIGIGAPAGSRVRRSVRPQQPAKPATARVSDPSPPELCKTLCKGVQESGCALSKESWPWTYPQKPSRAVVEMRAKVKLNGNGAGHK